MKLLHIDSSVLGPVPSATCIGVAPSRVATRAALESNREKLAQAAVAA
ncbi:MAG TPA: hypothetical protein VGL87_04570 [Steroidobacteraceae bacterium]|jgi:hypothetical protein